MAEKASRTVMELRAGSLAESDVVVEQLAGREAISTPFDFELALRPSASDPLDLADLLGKEGLLTVRRPDGDDRRVHGRLASVELSGVSAGKPHYRVRLVPLLALLDQTRDSRIFQAKSTPDIVKAVLGDHDVPVRLAVQGSYPKRELCVQYQESVLAFVSRLLEEEGIFYFFEHEEDRHTVVLADAPGACAAIPGDATLPFRDGRESRDEQAAEHVFALQRAHRERPGKATLRDFDFLRPDLDLTASSEASGDEKREVYRYPGGYTGPAVGKKLAKVRLEELRAGRVGISGESTCLRLSPGFTFDVAEHADDAYNGSLLAIRVEHHGRQELRSGGGVATEGSYRNTFVAAPAKAPLRPPRRTPRPRLAGAQTAIVVGPKGEEIHTDEHGRIKVQFHWDRLGKRDEQAGCFLRVLQGWAGAGFGQTFLPRIGQEVVVRFLEGDPDRPLVVGAVFNGANAPPVELPADRTWSTLRSDSSLGGGGSNELRFEDTRGEEQLFRHAQHDERTVVESDKHQKIGVNEQLEVVHDRSRKIKRDQRLKVALADAATISGKAQLTVAASRTTSVAGASADNLLQLKSVTVAGAMTTVVRITAAETVGAVAGLTIGAGYAVTVAGAGQTVVGKVLSRQVAGTSTELVGGTRDESVKGSATDKTGGDFAEQVEGNVGQAVKGDSQETVSGKGAVEVTHALTLSAKKIALESDKLTILVGGQVLWQMQSGSVGVGASKFNLEASKDLIFKGSKLDKPGSGSAASENLKLKALDDLRKSRASAKLTAEDADGAPLSNVRFKAELPDGSVHEGVTDGAGGASIPAAKEGQVKVSFPDLDAGSWKSK